jgi:hypothetical protein
LSRNPRLARRVNQLRGIPDIRRHDDPGVLARDGVPHFFLFDLERPLKRSVPEDDPMTYIVRSFSVLATTGPPENPGLL